MLIDEIKKANVLAMKNKDYDARVALSLTFDRYTLASIEARATGKELTDLDLIQIIGKVLKELADEQAEYILAGNPERANGIKKQAETLKHYMPTMMSEDEIKAEINKLSDKSIPSVMRHFKASFQGKADMGLVNLVVKKL